MSDTKEIDVCQAGTKIEINGHQIDPESQMSGGNNFEEDASKTNYIVIQFTDLPSFVEEQTLRNLQVQFCRKIPPSTWLAKYEPSDLAPIRQLPFVVYANPFQQTLAPALKTKLRQELKPKENLRRGFAATAIVSNTNVGPSSRPSLGILGDTPNIPVPTPLELRDVWITIHPLSRTPEDILGDMVSRHGIPRERLALELGSLRGSLTADEMLRVAGVDDIAGVYEMPEMVFDNHLVSQAVKTREASQLATSYLDSSFKLDGEGQIIAIADTGLDRGYKVSLGGILDDFVDVVHPFFRNRILHLDPRSEATGTDSDGSVITRKGKCDDLSGHGTHVAGIALGSYGGMAANPAICLRGPRIDGVAPKASLIMQQVAGCPVYKDGNLIKSPTVEILSLLLGKGVDWSDFFISRIFLDPYYGYPDGFSGEGSSVKPTGPSTLSGKQVARIHSGSWGESLDAFSGYYSQGELTDRIVFQHPDYLLVRSAGNEGDSKKTNEEREDGLSWRDGQITGWASAKNAITVGACYNNQYIKTKTIGSETRKKVYTQYAPPANGDDENSGGERIPASFVPQFSSRGPTVAGIETAAQASHRDIIKPDVVAPGVAIYSANSRSRLSEPRQGHAPNGDPLCAFGSGSSMATAVVAGAAALLRQALSKQGCPDPSAALLKALIINGAVDLHDEQGMLYKGNPTDVGGGGVLSNVPITRAPNDIQGWGRLNIADSVKNILDTEYCGYWDAKLAEGVEPGSSKDPRLKPDLNPKDSHPYAAIIQVPALAKYPGRKGNIKATLAWTDAPGPGLQDQLALSLVFCDPQRQDRNIAVDWGRTGTDPLLKRIAGNNVQKLEVRGIDWTAQNANDKSHEGVEVIVTVTEVNIVSRVDGDASKKIPQAYAICWKVWYTDP